MSIETIAPDCNTEILDDEMRISANDIGKDIDMNQKSSYTNLAIKKIAATTFAFLAMVFTYATISMYPLIPLLGGVGFAASVFFDIV